jgi:multidrug resistance efflux pump
MNKSEFSIKKETTMKNCILPVLLLALLLAGCSDAPAAVPTASAEAQTVSAVTAEGKISPRIKANLAFIQAGSIGEVRVKPGDQVAEDAVLARLVGIESVQAEVAAAEVEHALAAQALETLHREALRSSVDAQIAVQNALKMYDSSAGGWHLPSNGDSTSFEIALDAYIQAENDFRSAQATLERHAASDRDALKRQNAEQAVKEENDNRIKRYANLLKEIPDFHTPVKPKHTTLLKSIAALELARLQVERLEEGVDRELALTAEARLRAADAHLAAAHAALSFYELRAPFAGTVLSTSHLSTSEAALPGQPVVFLADTSSWVVETKDLAEIDIPRVASGQKVLVMLDAFPEETFGGRVSALDPIGREYLGDMTYPVTITLDDADPRFLWNMTATITIANQ